MQAKEARDKRGDDLDAMVEYGTLEARESTMLPKGSGKLEYKVQASAAARFAVSGKHLVLGTHPPRGEGRKHRRRNARCICLSISCLVAGRPAASPTGRATDRPTSAPLALQVRRTITGGKDEVVGSNKLRQEHAAGSQQDPLGTGTSGLMPSRQQCLLR